MKKYIVLLIILIPVVVLAFGKGASVKGGSGGGVAAAGGDCSGTATLLWEMNSNDVTDGGCSDGDETASDVGSPGQGERPRALDVVLALVGGLAYLLWLRAALHGVVSNGRGHDDGIRLRRARHHGVMHLGGAAHSYDLRLTRRIQRAGAQHQHHACAPMHRLRRDRQAHPTARAVPEITDGIQIFVGGAGGHQNPSPGQTRCGAHRSAGFSRPDAGAQ